MSGQAYLTRLNAGRWGDVVVALVVLTLTVFLTGRGRSGENTILFQLGPNDASYISGFALHYEVTDGVSASRWTSYDASIDLPVSIEGGPLELSYRFWRVFPETAISEVYLDEQLIDTFESRGGQTRLRHVTLAAVSESPVSIHFKVDSHERQNLGLRLDWVSLKTGERSRIRARGWALWLPGILATFLYALFRVARFERRPAIVLVLPWIATTAICARFDPFSFAFVIQKIAPAAIVLSLFAAWWLWRRDSGRWALAIFVLGFLVKGAGLFHPVTFYPDVANMRRYVDIYPETTGTMAQRGVATQEQTGVGYPRTVGGKDYAFPYSPLYFLPFTYLPTPGAVEDGVRLFGLAAASLQVLAVFWLATTLFDARVAVAAAFFSAFLPPLFSRLVLALHATLVGHFLDLLAMSAVLLLSLKPESSKRFAAVGGATLVSFLEYTSSYFSLTAFIGIFALFDRRLTFRLVGVLLVAGTLTILGLYGPFVWAFATEMLPAFLAGTAGVSASGSRAPPLAALSRIPLFLRLSVPGARSRRFRPRAAAHDDGGISLSSSFTDSLSSCWPARGRFGGENVQGPKGDHLRRALHRDALGAHGRRALPSRPRRFHRGGSVECKPRRFFGVKQVQKLLGELRFTSDGGRSLRPTVIGRPIK